MRRADFTSSITTDKLQPRGVLSTIDVSPQIRDATWRHLQHVVREFFRRAAWEYVFCRVRENDIDFQCSPTCRRITLVSRNDRIYKNIAGREESIRSFQSPDGRFGFELRGRLYRAAPLVVELMRETATMGQFDLSIPANRDAAIERYWNAAISAHGNPAFEADSSSVVSTVLHAPKPIGRNTAIARRASELTHRSATDFAEHIVLEQSRTKLSERRANSRRLWLSPSCESPCECGAGCLAPPSFCAEA